MFIFDEHTLNRPWFMAQFLSDAHADAAYPVISRNFVTSSVILDHISAKLLAKNSSFFLADGAWMQFLSDTNPVVKGFAVEKFALAHILKNGISSGDLNVQHGTCKLLEFDKAHVRQLSFSSDKPTLCIPKAWNYKRIDAALVTADMFVAIQITLQSVTRHKDTRLFFEEDAADWNIGDRKQCLLWIVPENEALKRNQAPPIRACKPRKAKTAKTSKSPNQDVVELFMGLPTLDKALSHLQ